MKPPSVLRGSGGRSGPPSAPASEVPGSGTGARNPLAGEAFRALRELRTEFGRGGLPPRERRTPEDEARIVTYFVLRETTHILDQFRRAVEEGKPCRLVVAEHGRQLGKVVVEITIEDEHS